MRAITGVTWNIAGADTGLLIPFFESDILPWLIRNGYLLMFLVMLVEGPAVTATGALGAALGHFNVFVVFLLSFLGNFLPDVLYYAIGRRSGQWVLDKFGPRIGIPDDRRERASVFISANVGKWLFFIKTVPFISPPGLAVMGALGVPIKQFIWWDAFIVALTSLGFTLLGYYSGKGYDVLRQVTQYSAFGLFGIFLMFILTTMIYNRAARRFTGRMRALGSEEHPVGQQQD